MLAALPLKCEIGFFLVNPKIPLQDSLGAIHQTASFRQFGKLRFFGFENRSFDFRAHEETDYLNQIDLPLAVKIGLDGAGDL